MSVIISGITALLSFVLYLWVPSKNPFPFSLLIFYFLTITTASLILSTGNTSSIFISLWMILSIFAGVFGIWGILPIFLLIGIFTSFEYIARNLSFEIIMVIILSCIVPLFVGSIIWHQSKKSQQIDNNKDYKNLKNELSEVASRSEIIIDAIGDGVVAINNTSLIQLINPAAQDLLGWSKQDALNLSYKSVLQLVNQKDEELDITNDPIQQVLNTNQQIRTNALSITTKSGKKIMISLVVSPVGEMGAGIIAVFHDITSEKTEEREQAEFISTASHEMRTPVASIEGYLGLALNPQTAQIDDRARDYINKAHASAQHLGRLFQDLLDVSKADDGRMSNNPKVINIVTYIHDIAQGLRSSAEEKGIKLSFKPIPDDNTSDKNIAPVFLVNVDNDHIREVVNNLIENAIKYTPKGEVLIDITGDEEHVLISIKDSGIGIPAEDMPHLFQKFYRVDNKDTREIGGTGLGLYLSRKLVELMNGRVWAESIYTEGSTFFIELQRINNQEAKELAEQDSLKLQEKTLLQVANQNNQPKITEPVLKTPTNPLVEITTNQQQTPSDLNQNNKNSVPRGQALTPEQIASYVAQQRALAAKQINQPMQNQTQTTANPIISSRPQSISIPKREEK